MPPADDCDPIQDARHAREAACADPETIPARPPTVADLHRRWMHARLRKEQAERAQDAAVLAYTAACREEEEAAAPLAELLLADVVRGLSTRSRRRTVAIAGEVLAVIEAGDEYPGEYRITPVAVDLVSLD